MQLLLLPKFPPPPPPTENSIVRNYNSTDSNTPLPPININNYITRTNDILSRTLTNDNTRLLSNVLFNRNEEDIEPDLEAGTIVSSTELSDNSLESTSTPNYVIKFIKYKKYKNKRLISTDRSSIRWRQ